MFSAKGPLPGTLQSLNTQVWKEWYPNEGQNIGETEMECWKSTPTAICKVPTTMWDLGADMQTRRRK